MTTIHKRFAGPVDEIIFSLGCPVRAGAEKLDAGSLAGLDEDLVEEVDLGHYGFDFVEAVGAFAGNEET